MTAEGNRYTVFESRASYVIYNVLKGRSGKVLLPANVCPIVPATVIKAGLVPAFLDISLETYEIDHDLLLREVEKKGEYAALIYVRTYGNLERDLNALFQELKQTQGPDFLIIDDRCLGICSFSPEPSVADLQLYSSGYSKVAELNWGGYAFLKGGLRYSRQDVIYREVAHDALLDEFNRAMADLSTIASEVCQTDWLSSEIPSVDFEDYSRQIMAMTVESLKHKEEINRIYSDTIPASVCLPDGYHNWRFNIRVADRQRLLKNIFDAGHFASGHYANMCVNFAQKPAPNASVLANEVVNLFNDYRFSPEKAREVAALVVKHINDND
ncbi:MAG: hypothetical protein Roseis2KO_02020 [Roseivirga sp.]